MNELKYVDSPELNRIIYIYIYIYEQNEIDRSNEQNVKMCLKRTTCVSRNQYTLCK